MKARALIDSGSTYTLISKALYNRLPKYIPLTGAPRVRSLTGELVPIVGQGIVRIEGVAVSVLVASDLDYDVYIGADLLPLCILDAQQKMFVIGDRKLKMDLRKESFQKKVAGSGAVIDAKFDLQTVLNQYHDVFSEKETL